MQLVYVYVYAYGCEKIWGHGLRRRVEGQQKHKTLGANHHHQHSVFHRFNGEPLSYSSILGSSERLPGLGRSIQLLTKLLLFLFLLNFDFVLYWLTVFF